MTVLVVLVNALVHVKVIVLPIVRMLAHLIALDSAQICVLVLVVITHVILVQEHARIHVIRHV